MIATQDSPVPNGKTFNFWAGGHTVYFMCILLVNLVLLRGTHNWQGWGEALITLQVASFFLVVWLDSVLLKYGPIAYFWDEFMSSRAAWLGVFLVGAFLLIENSIVDMLGILKGLKGKDAQVGDLASSADQQPGGELSVTFDAKMKSPRSPRKAEKSNAADVAPYA